MEVSAPKSSSKRRSRRRRVLSGSESSGERELIDSLESSQVGVPARRFEAWNPPG